MSQTQALAPVARGIHAASLAVGEIPSEDSLAGYGEAEFFFELARMVVGATGVRDLDAMLQDAAERAASQQAFLDPRAVLEQSSPPLDASATRDIAVTARIPAQMSLF